MRSAKRRGDRRNATSSSAIKKTAMARRPGRWELTTSSERAPMKRPVAANEATEAMKRALTRSNFRGAALRSQVRRRSKSLTRAAELSWR